MNLIGTETVFMRQMQDTKQDKRNPRFPPISCPASAGLIGSTGNNAAKIVSNPQKAKTVSNPQTSQTRMLLHVWEMVLTWFWFGIA